MDEYQPRSKGAAPRTFPELTHANRAFWTSGREGTWSLPRCSTCRQYVHPGQFWCPWCLTASLSPEPVSGRGTVFTFTVNRYPWLPGWDVPYVAAVIELEDQEGLRVTSNLVGVDADEVTIGMPVAVTFEQHGEYWVPLFRKV